MKKSGLADSPFFTKPTPFSPASLQDNGMAAHVSVQPQEVFKRTDAQAPEHTNAQTRNGTDEHLNERADAQPHKRTTAQIRNTSTNPAPRQTTRESFDIYEDQLQSFEELRLRLKKQRGKHITKGELMRELLEEILPSKK